MVATRYMSAEEKEALRRIRLKQAQEAAERAVAEQEAADEEAPSDNEARAAEDLSAVESEGNADVLAGLLEIENPGQVRWQVWRTQPYERYDGKVFGTGFLCELTSAELTMANLAKKCGPGKYIVKGLRGSRYAGSKTFSIIEPTFDPNSMPQQNANSSIQDVLAVIAADKAKQSQALKEWIAILAPILAPVALKLLDRPRENPLTDALTALKGMQAVMPAQAAPESSVQKLAELKELLATVKEILPEAKESTGSTWVDLVRDGIQQLGPLAGAVAAKAAANRAGAAPAQPRPAIAAATSEAPQIAAPQGPTGDPMFALLGWFQGHIPLLVNKASRNSDPSLYAEMLFDDLPDDADPAFLLQLLNRPDWWQMLSQFAPAVQPYAGWFAALQGELVREIQEAMQEASGQPPAADVPAPMARPAAVVAPPVVVPSPAGVFVPDAPEQETEIQRMTRLAAENSGEFE